MTALDVKFLALATRLITKNGKLIQYTSETAGIYNPSSGSVDKTMVTVSVKALVEDYTLANSGGVAFNQGLIESGDKKFSIPAAGFNKPKLGDKITLNTDVYQVVRIHETWSGEEISLFELQGRK